MGGVVGMVCVWVVGDVGYFVLLLWMVRVFCIVVFVVYGLIV